MEKRFTVSNILFMGRSANEYIKMFNLSEKSLEGEKILDCCAGASSFNYEMSQKGYNITACDILYNMNVDTLEKKCAADMDKIMHSLLGIEELYVWDFFKTPEKLQKHRTATYKKFIDDFRKEKGKYIYAQLPELPFEDNEFSLTLSSHLLFVYDDKLDLNFHKNSIDEMLRGTSKELRIFPLIGLNGNKSRYLDKIMEYLSTKKLYIEIKKVPYEFMRNANTMMKIKKQ